MTHDRMFILGWIIIGCVGLLMILMATMNITRSTVIPQPTPYPSGWTYDPN